MGYYLRQLDIKGFILKLKGKINNRLLPYVIICSQRATHDRTSMTTKLLRCTYGICNGTRKRDGIQMTAWSRGNVGVNVRRAKIEGRYLYVA